VTYGDHAVAALKHVPVIDLAPARKGSPTERRAVAAEIDSACRALGFLVISGHGIEPRLVQETREAALRFFALPLEEKMKLKLPPGPSRGYFPPQSQALAQSLENQSPPDLKETFNIGPVDVSSDAYFTAKEASSFFTPNLWPDAVPELQAAFTCYYRAMSGLATELMRLFALGLGLPEVFFDSKVDRHITTFSVLHYPPLAQPPLPGQLRAGAHTDFGSLTILQRDETPGGLEVFSGDAWIKVPEIERTFVVNLGDLMQDWTGGAWRSTLHRVVNPPDMGTAERLSMAFFHQPNWDAMISPLPVPGAIDRDFEPINSGAHVRAKVAKLKVAGGTAAA
jgi:isopenicillin N synthase-like dioxygenase